MRIVSLIASATEIVCALGLREKLVGRSHECDTPETVLSLPALTAPKFETDASSRAIDDAVRTLVRDGLAVYRVDQDLLRTLAPDVILTQDQCEVCAASLKDVEAAVCDWMGGPVRIVSLKPNCLADIWRDIARVGAALEQETDALRLVDTLKDRMTPAALSKPPPRIVCIEWIDPPMTAGHWIPELIEIAGGHSLLARAGGPSPYVTLDDIAAADPDIIVVAPCGFGVERSLQDMAALAVHPGWATLRAVREGHVAVADGNKHFNRPSPAVVDTVETLRDIIGYFRDGTPARLGAKIWQPWPHTMY